MSLCLPVFSHSRFTISEEPIKNKTGNNTFTKRVQRELDKFSPPEYELISQNPVTIGGNDGWRIEFRHTAPHLNYDRHIFEILTYANGKFYNLQYIEDPLKVPETRPLANKMVESFQIK